MQDLTGSWNRDPPIAIDSQVVLQQLDRMLKSRHFRNSRRYPAFLSHIVRRRLEGDIDSLKERILGIEVFQRAHDYDTAADPVVRISAGEVRKRIALYYHDGGTESELRIELPAGSYVPQFSPGRIASPAPIPGIEATEMADAVDANIVPSANVPAAEEISNERRGSSLRTAAWAVAGLIVLFGLGSLLWYRAWMSSPLQSMWRPFFGSQDAVLVVIGSPLGTLAGANPPPGVDPNLLDSHSHVHLAFTDALALANITGLLEMHQQIYRVQTSAATSLDDLRKRPVVMITAFSNQWSGRILSTLRYSLLRQKVSSDGTTVLGSIVDRNSGSVRWSFDFSQPVGVNTRDYAIVARLQSDLTEGPVMVVAGLGPSGTESAGEFVSSPEYLRQVANLAPAGWRNKNLELVLEVPVIDGKAGRARVVASEFW